MPLGPLTLSLSLSFLLSVRVCGCFLFSVIIKMIITSKSTWPRTTRPTVTTFSSPSLRQPIMGCVASPFMPCLSFICLFAATPL